MTNWSFQPIFDSYPAVAFLALGLILTLWIGPSFRQLHRYQRVSLLVLRALVVLLVIVAILRPTRVSTTSKPQTAVLLVLFDATRSMELPNDSGDKSRWEAQLEALRQIEPHLKELAGDLEVKVHPYDAQLGPPAWRNRRLRVPTAPGGRQTDIGSSLHEAVRRELGKRLAAVVLLGDGTQTAYQPTVELYDAARELDNLGYPLYTVTFGPAGDKVQSRDVAVENLPEQFTVFVKNKLEVRGLVRVRGYAKRDIPVRLAIEDQSGNRQVLGPVSVRADKDNEQLEVPLTYVPQQPGQYRMTLAADQQAGELVTENNQLTAFLTVLDGGLRVLYVEGEPRQEQKFIRWALDASPDIDLDFQWFPRRFRKDWPVELGDLFEQGNYDAYILGDCDSLVLGPENLRKLAAEVERGKGLIVLGGYHSFDPGGYYDTPLADVLPIEMNRLARQEFDQPDMTRWHVPGPLLMVPARSHPVTLLAAPGENEETWRGLPPLKGANLWPRVKEARGVQLLAQSPDNVPLLVAGEYGSGRVLAFAGDSTWQWWRQGHGKTHRRFWRQVVLWLTRRDDFTRNDVWIDLAQRRFPIGSRVTFTAGARTATGDAIRDASLTAAFHDAQGKATAIPLTRKDDDFSGTVDRVTQPGNCQIKVTAVDARGQSLGEATAHLDVTDQDVELGNPAADPAQMAQLARMTRAAGGDAVAPEQLPALLEKIKKNPPKLVEEVLTKWQLADTWWDAWLLLVCLICLLAAEWTLRKRWSMV
ncbi:MAG: hypothetical protein FJ276_25610 [Planctomycetes bacterium]|nr:hypothetical protein [Planctomycetota bacterium]